MTRPSALTVSAWLIGGPISGPLFLRAVRHWRAGDRILAGLYVAAIGSVWVILPSVLSWLIRVDAAYHIR